MTQLVHLYTFIVMILSPLTLTYIRFVKSISFTRFYWGLVKHEDLLQPTNGFVKKSKVYADDRYAFNYNRRNGHWTATNMTLKTESSCRDGQWCLVYRHGVPRFSFILCRCLHDHHVFYYRPCRHRRCLTCTTNIKRFKNKEELDVFNAVSIDDLF